ncbi:hypothetical protein JG687_00013299 [Phytophthora cactorum]|uniref:Uncharacterized protein n=1 Tax=Phytophthora cactorum TaxID=29920 RepID=A0A8T1CWM2_9STRA|nr:hypothetical protein GQ600_2292 [Phytophthora cactorum]KAG2761534.1 hypothetical protein Pcac1_g26602 [Phytophthora cactorum]KAG2815717.1 hypothetical protein PC111_g13460 [Phytophthora cactorum]KAG2852820.1 hypothetical protein PC113_g14684 [Phytophthora cactorum]KAG2913883.1 hypothetical protein PC114_g8409 [Phytophthora cactorum]
MEELNEQVQIVRSNTKSKSVYLYGIVKYILWLHANKPDIVDPKLGSFLAQSLQRMMTKYTSRNIS